MCVCFVDALDQYQTAGKIPPKKGKKAGIPSAAGVDATGIGSGTPAASLLVLGVARSLSVHLSLAVSLKFRVLFVCSPTSHGLLVLRTYMLLGNTGQYLGTWYFCNAGLSKFGRILGKELVI